MSITDRLMKLAWNPNCIDKNEAGNASLFSNGWVNGELTVEEFTTAVTEHGWAYCAQLKGARKGSNFLACNVASVDVDHGLTIEEALANPFVHNHALLLYTTARHTPNAHRFRVVLLLPETIVRPSRMRAINRGLARLLSGDMAATDPTRISYGNRGAQVHYIGRGKVSPELLRELIADAGLPDDTDLPTREIVSNRSCVTLDPRQELQLTDGRRMLLCDVPLNTPVHCPVHPDENACAFTLQNRRGVPGVYCSACWKSYWSQELRQDEYDPDDFVRTAREIAAAAKPVPPDLDPDVWPNQSGLAREHITACRVTFVSGQAAPTELLPGITLVRSDKGTGKTEAMKRLAARVKTVLLVGHRRTLIRGSCKRLNLVCYLDLSKRKTARASGTNVEANLAAFIGEHDDDR